MTDWTDKLKSKLNLNKVAIDKLSDDELDSNTLPPVEDAAPPMDAPATGDATPIPSPLVRNNKYLVKTDQTEFLVELNPSIVTEDQGQMANPEDPMNNTATNPEANPELLDQWLNSSKPATKPYEHNEQGTVDPLSQEEEQDPAIQVHKQAHLDAVAEDYASNPAGQDSVPVTQGADKSNAYPPCKYCANYLAETGECTQGLDVEKVQAAKSCSWLNANISPFGKPKDPEEAHKDQEIYNSDITDSGNGSSNQVQQNIQNRASKSKISDYLKNFWS